MRTVIFSEDSHSYTKGQLHNFSKCALSNGKLAWVKKTWSTNREWKNSHGPSCTRCLGDVEQTHRIEPSNDLRNVDFKWRCERQQSWWFLCARRGSPTFIGKLVDIGASGQTLHLDRNLDILHLLWRGAVGFPAKRSPWQSSMKTNDKATDEESMRVQELGQREQHLKEQKAKWESIKTQFSDSPDSSLWERCITVDDCLRTKDREVACWRVTDTFNGCAFVDTHYIQKKTKMRSGNC